MPWAMQSVFPTICISRGLPVPGCHNFAVGYRQPAPIVHTVILTGGACHIVFAGLFVVIDGYAVGTNTAELEKLFLECHHFGVTHVFVIPAGEDTDAKDLAKFECLRLSKAYLLNVSFFATLADCLGTRHANVFTATSSPRTGAVGLYEASFVGGSSGAYVDASPTDDTTIVVSCASSTSTALATDTIEIDAASKLTSPQTLFVP